MAQEVRPAGPAWFWLVAIAAFLWEAMGCYAYLTQVAMDAGQLAQLPPEQAELYQSMPAWVTAVYAVAVWVGLSGAILLLMRQGWARHAFAISLIAVLVQFGWVWFISSARSALPASAAILPGAIIVVAAFLFWFSTLARRKGWVA